MNQTSLKHKPYSLYDSRYSELTRTSKSKNHIKNKTNCLRVMENRCIWEEISLMNACCLLVFYQVLNAVQCLMETRNDMSFKKETENMVFLQVKDLIHIIVKFRTKKICILLSSTSHPFEWDTTTKYCHWAPSKEQIESLYFPEGK